MEADELQRAVAAAVSTASALSLPVDEAVVLQNSNKAAVHLRPCEVLARVAPEGRHVAPSEIKLATLLADMGAPVGVLDPRVEPRVYVDDNFAVTLWTYYEAAMSPEVSVDDYARALEQLHTAMRRLSVTTPHFMDRVAEAHDLVDNPELTPELTYTDREVLRSTLREQGRLIDSSDATQQLLHGEPHPGNVLSTHQGPLFIDLETCCCGPVEFDIAHAPKAVGDRYHGADQDLLSECRKLVLAMVAAWRWDATDQFPDGRRSGLDLVDALRHGPPWPTASEVMGLG
jgi:aminoglycoside phosphotransferase (APT) family kinase protein